MTWPERVFCITGMHRSGTSLIGAVVHLLGADFGPEETMLAPGLENPKGFWEQGAMADLNDEILAVLGGSWRDPPVLPDGWELSSSLDGFRERGGALLGHLFGGAKIVCWKDPRTSILLPFWRTVLPIAATIHAYRDPRHVVQSLAVRDGIEPEHGAYLWLRYVVGAQRSDPGNLRINYARFFDDLDRCLVLISDFLGLPYPPAVHEAAGELVDPSLWRARSTAEGGPMMRRALELFDLLEGSAETLDITVERLHRLPLVDYPSGS